LHRLCTQANGALPPAQLLGGNGNDTLNAAKRTLSVGQPVVGPEPRI
jgi:hypothetical protein